VLADQFLAGALVAPVARLDLSAVTFVDRPGIALLRDLLGRGVTLAASIRGPSASRTT
jgi:hypothetical protein